ncbi:MAG TPA: site-specific integrase [Candidatus Sulfobium mesophilum]|nr:site-specific integrase [Candidatus Sulfobium mesophilum]
MNTQEAIEFTRNHHLTALKHSTNTGYELFFKSLKAFFGDRALEPITAEDIGRFLESFTAGVARGTRHLRYAQTKAFFSFIINEYGLDIKNPCANALLMKQYKNPKPAARKILDKELVDELIYNTTSAMERLILELQARCGLRIGEVLKLKADDVTDRKLLIREPKSGKESETAFMPEQIAKRLSEYITEEKLGPDDRLFPVCYTTARSLIKRLGEKFNMKVSPHDLRRHSATYASRNGVPLEIISKVLLRHHDLKTTQVYLGKVDDTEAIRWMDVLHGK